MNDRDQAGGQPPPSVATAIREAVFNGEFVPGQRLIEADLCAEFHATRSAVRMALQELASEGLVEVQRHRGARVRQVSLAEAIEITEVRRVLEGLLAAKAAIHADAAQVAELRRIGEAMREAAEQLDPLGYSQLNAQLHALIRAAAGHHTATSIIERLRGQLVRHQFRLALQPGRPAVSLRQHQEIIEAIAARDPAAADAAMQAHLDDVLLALRKLGQGDEVA